MGGEARSAAVVALQPRIDASRRARAIDRAWGVAKALEGDGVAERRIAQLRNLVWVEPAQREGKGITRRIDFEWDFPEGVTPLMPVPMEFGVYAPASRLVPGEEGMDFTWTMPVLKRMAPAREVPADVRSTLGAMGSVSTRSVIEVVTFMPFPRVGATPEEQFTPEFFVGLTVDAKLPKPGDLLGVVARFGGNVVKQFVNCAHPNVLTVFADPHHETLFKAEMLVALSKAELAKTPENAGVLDLFVYRVTRGGMPSIKKMFEGEGYPFLGGSGSSTGMSGSDFSSSRLFGEPMRGGGLMRGGGDLLGAGFGTRPRFTSIPGENRTASLLSPADAPKQVGDTRISEGTRGEEVKYETLGDYVLDNSFAVQQVSIRVEGVREGSRDEVVRRLELLDGRQ